MIRSQVARARAIRPRRGPLAAWSAAAIGAALALPGGGFAAEPAPADSAQGLEQLIQRLPADWGPVLERYQAHLGSEMAAAAGSTEGELKTGVIEELSKVPGAEDFVLDHAFDGSIPAGEEMGSFLYRFLWNDRWAANPRLPAVLERALATEADPETSAELVALLHALAAMRVRELNEGRERQLSSAGLPDQAPEGRLSQLQHEDQDLSYVADEIQIPGFLRAPPPVFTVKTAGPSIRVVAIGDFGTDGRDEHLVAAAMLRYEQSHPYDFGITLGDNFYFPMTSPEDPHWDRVWQKLYGPLHITFYPCFGNHDWGGDMPAAELCYTYRSANWHFPAPYYTYVAGPVQFFVINPEFYGTGRGDGKPRIPAAQVSWLKAELEKSTARWKVVYGHFPLYQWSYNEESLIAPLMPVLKGRADLYLSGHKHNLQQHQPVDGVNFFVIGASGRGGSPVNPAAPGTIWAKMAYGFGVLEADAHTFTVRIIGVDGSELHEATFRK